MKNNPMATKFIVFLLIGITCVTPARGMITLVSSLAKAAKSISPLAQAQAKAAATQYLVKTAKPIQITPETLPLLVVKQPLIFKSQGTPWLKLFKSSKPCAPSAVTIQNAGQSQKSNKSPQLTAHQFLCGLGLLTGTVGTTVTAKNYYANPNQPNSFLEPDIETTYINMYIPEKAGWEGEASITLPVEQKESQKKSICSGGYAGCTSVGIYLLTKNGDQHASMRIL